MVSTATCICGLDVTDAEKMKAHLMAKPEHEVLVEFWARQDMGHGLFRWVIVTRRYLRVEKVDYEKQEIDLKEYLA